MRSLHLTAQLRTMWSRIQFCPTPWDILVNPYYIIRRGLYRSIRYHARLASGRVLDFGAGSSPYRHLFKCDEYVPVDIEASGHPTSHKKASIYYDGQSLPFANEYFDFILCSEVFEHIFNPGDVLNELNRVLRRDGLMLLTVPFVWEEHEQPFDFARYTSFGIQHLLEAHEFQLESLEKTTGYIETIAQLFVSYWAGRAAFRWRPLRLIASPLIFAPILLLGIAMDALSPSDTALYHNSVIVARRR